MAVARVILGKQKDLFLGNLDAQRDWGHAKDYVRAMWQILQQDQPDDFVIATGKTTKVRKFVELVFNEVGIKLKFEGQGVNEVGIIDDIDYEVASEMVGKDNAKYLPKLGAEVVKVDETYFRPTEVDLLIGDPTKAKNVLGWEPEYSLEDIVKEMVDADLRIARDRYDLL